LCAQINDYPRPQSRLVSLSWNSPNGSLPIASEHLSNNIPRFPGLPISRKAASGGVYGFDAVFKLMPKADGTGTEMVLHSFAGGLDGEYPDAGVVLDAAGKLDALDSTIGTRLSPASVR
jgi:hypothetical protein